MTTPDLTMAVTDSLARVPAEDWDALVGSDNPFVEHAFLASLEEAGCVGPGTGWTPRYLLVHRGSGPDTTLVGAAPAYAKTDGYGEYIFDWGWAEAAERARVPYYPKLTVAVPFTPATGPRLLVHPEADAVAVEQLLAKGALSAAQQLGMHSVHWLFTTEQASKTLEAAGYMRRLSYQFHWRNQGWGCFDDYLGAMKAKRRKEIRRERRACAQGVVVDVEPASALTPVDLSALHRCYTRTIDGKWGRPYLNRRWFDALGPRLGHRALVVTARRNGALVAGALAFRKGRHLYGRYWGALEDHRALHFELCYYRLIQYACDEGMTLFEAGAQGYHKLARGFLPAVTHSAHWIRHPGLADAVDDFLSDEAKGVRARCAAMAESSPFRAPAALTGVPLP